MNSDKKLKDWAKKVLIIFVTLLFLVHSSQKFKKNLDNAKEYKKTEEVSLRPKDNFLLKKTKDYENLPKASRDNSLNLTDYYHNLTKKNKETELNSLTSEVKEKDTLYVNSSSDIKKKNIGTQKNKKVPMSLGLKGKEVKQQRIQRKARYKVDEFQGGEIFEVSKKNEIKISSGQYYEVQVLDDQELRESNCMIVRTVNSFNYQSYNIPRGSKLYGEVFFGKRVNVVFTRCELPNGHIIEVNFIAYDINKQKGLYYAFNHRYKSELAQAAETDILQAIPYIGSSLANTFSVAKKNSNEKRKKSASVLELDDGYSLFIRVDD